MTSINDVFDNMDRWRHLPAYQLERRADIFFSAYLPDVLSTHLGVRIDSLLPEFPIRIGTIYPKVPINQSFKADYLAVARQASTAFLVELKTDDASRRDKQDWYLERAQEVGLPSLLAGLRDIYQATSSKRKYRHLLRALHDMGLIVLNEDATFSVTAADYGVRLLYIQPNRHAEEADVITFGQVADAVERHGDPLSARFAQSLRSWAAVAAGDA